MSGGLLLLLLKGCQDSPLLQLLLLLLLLEFTVRRPNAGPRNHFVSFAQICEAGGKAEEEEEERTVCLAV